MPSPEDKQGQRGTHLLLLACGVALLPVLIVWATYGLRRVDATDVPTQVYIAICNDGVVGNGELCDFGAGNNTGAYSSTTADRVCAPGCRSWGPYCGDGILQVRFNEQCDQGSGNGPTALCSTSCETIPPAPPPGAPSRGSTPEVPGAVQGAIPSEFQTRVVLRGKAYPLSTVSILLDGKKVGTAQTDTNADFVYSTANISPGTATFGFVGVDRSGVQSITTSVVFDVVQSAVTTVNNIFLPPTIALSSNRVPPGDPLTVSGFTVPNAKVSTSIEGSGTTTITATSDQVGAWAIQVDTASLAKGFHSVKASFALSDLVKSGFGRSLNFFVGTEIPKGSVSPDLNHDGKVNLVDFSIFLLSWNTTELTTDFNQDGTTNLADFSIMLFQWTG